MQSATIFRGLTEKPPATFRVETQRDYDYVYVSLNNISVSDNERIIMKGSVWGAYTAFHVWALQLNLTICSFKTQHLTNQYKECYLLGHAGGISRDL